MLTDCNVHQPAFQIRETASPPDLIPDVAGVSSSSGDSLSSLPALRSYQNSIDFPLSTSTHFPLRV